VDEGHDRMITVTIADMLSFLPCPALNRHARRPQGGERPGRPAKGEVTGD
jgi:hypothetical protein